MPQYTDNYGLIKPYETENYDVEVQNSNMDKIDLLIKTAEDKINVLDNKLVEHDLRFKAVDDIINDVLDNKLVEHDLRFKAVDDIINVLDNKLEKHKEDYAQQRQQDQLKIAKVEKELNDYKATMQQINIHQSPTQKASGHGIISLPPNAAEGRVSSVGIKGLTATNLIKNGDFSNGTTGWSAVHGNITANNNIATHTINNWFRGDIIESGKHKAVIGNKLFVRAKVRVTNSQCQEIHLIIEYLKNNVWVWQDTARLLNPVENQWYNFFAVLELRDGFDYEDYRLAIRHQYKDENTALGKQMEVKEVIMIDLTAHGLDHLTAEEVNTMLPNWFDGTKSTISAFRIRSVSKDETQESSAYVIATDADTGEILELRSLPSGTKDEIDATRGKLIKRVSDWITLDGNERWSVGASAGGWNTVGKTVPFFSYDSSIGTTNKQRNGSVYSPDFPCYKAGEAGLITGGDREGFSIGIRDYVAIRIAKSKLTGYSDELSSDEKIALFKQWLSQNPIRLIYQLAEPVEIPIQVSGSIASHPNGTIYIEPVTTAAGIYNGGIEVTYEQLGIKELETISKIDYMTGIETFLDVSKTVISEDGKSFTHPDLEDGDIVFFEYIHNLESTTGETEVEYYDSRFVFKDRSTGKFYKVVYFVDNGVLDYELVEV